MNHCADLTFEQSLALLFIAAWVSIIGGWALHALLKSKGFIK